MYQRQGMFLERLLQLARRSRAPGRQALESLHVPLGDRPLMAQSPRRAGRSNFLSQRSSNKCRSEMDMALERESPTTQTGGGLGPPPGSVERRPRPLPQHADMDVHPWSVHVAHPVEASGVYSSEGEVLAEGERHSVDEVGRVQDSGITQLALDEPV